MSIPSWLVIAGVTLAVALLANLLSRQDIRWFMHLQRPQWLTFEKAIPVIWTVVFICGAWSAYLVWENSPGTNNTWLLMGVYLLVEIVIVAYTPVMCKLKSLKAGTVIGATGFFLGCILTVLVLPIKTWAAILLLPYLIWSPIGTYVTWKMMQLNPADA
ncbi:MAG: TspO/MBR family protein [Oscillatoriales cyanobacterium RM1_1_9]|nr:TspO/MBR family protein [Oscillatoriales cyanobacterium SM2_3_0]NJO44824.1 TspO/MBR family protein [Oscillatoriales cyanobacterium RM2_1_1]NJO70941.1 TspO/MBR family protein [Oscillatoriales cyanobacterium RM1_1_9]